MFSETFSFPENKNYKLYYPPIFMAKDYKGWGHVPHRHTIWPSLTSSGHKCEACEVEAGNGSEAAGKT